MSHPSLNESVEWRIPIWAPAVKSTLDRASTLLPSDAKVLEIGYNTGMMSCYMASHYGWNLVGYDINESLRTVASRKAQYYGLEGRIDFRVCLPENTFSIAGPYDAVFLKSVLYHISEKSVYRSWLNWICSLLPEGGVLIAVENGKGGYLDRVYRKAIKKSRWASFLLFDTWTKHEFEQRFREVEVRYFGRYSQFFSPFQRLCSLVRSVEEKFFPPNAEHCFVASVIAQR